MALMCLRVVREPQDEGDTVVGALVEVHGETRRAAGRQVGSLR